MTMLAVLLLVLAATGASTATRGNGDCYGHCVYDRPLRPHSVSIAEFGAIGDGVTVNTIAFLNAIFYLSSFGDTGGGQLYIPSGRWLTESFCLTSHLTLLLEKDAVLIAPQNVSQWPLVKPLPSYGRGLELPGERYRSFLYGYNLTDVVITGEGAIDGRGSVWWELFRSHSLNYSRPHILELVNCSDVVISNLIFLDSPAWSIHPVYCSNLKIQNVRIFAPLESPFTQGIVPDSCSEVYIENGTISVGHDAISLKSGWDQYGIAYGAPSAHIRISNVHLRSSSGSAVSFGDEMSGGISDIHAKNLRIHDSSTAISFRTIRGRGGYIKDVVISDIRMNNVQTAIQLIGQYGGHPDDDYDRFALPLVQRITLKNVIGMNISTAGVLSGIDGDPFTGICLSNVTLSITSYPSSSWTCSNVVGFSDWVFPEPCSDLVQIRYSNSSLMCFSLLNHNDGHAAA